MDENKNLHQISIELDNDSSNGEYSNLVIVTHSSAEFVMDFTKILPGVKKAKAYTPGQSICASRVSLQLHWFH